MIEITDEIRISEQELVFKFSRSSGPGGQNVNKVLRHSKKTNTKAPRKPGQ